MAIVSLVALAGFMLAGIAGASSVDTSSPSDPDRAVFHDGNATTCADVGFPNSTLMGASDNSSNADANVSGTVKTNAGAIHTGEGDELNVTLLKVGVVIDAVVVKGGAGYNVYSAAGVLPPLLLADQHYISPFNGGGNVPTISHWFVCYRFTAVETPGSLVVTKALVPPPVGKIPLTPLPTSFTAVVNCNDGVHINIQVTFGPSGGAGTPASITGLAIGTKCTVVETGTAAPPNGPTVTYSPVGANIAPGVTIANATPVAVTITNNFSGVAVQAEVVAVAVNPAFTG